MALKTGHLARFIIFGSFVTSKLNPNDIDIFIMMENDFDITQVPEPENSIFHHSTAQNLEGASIFWIRRLAVLDSGEATINHWMLKRDGTRRGIIEVISDDS